MSAWSTDPCSPRRTNDDRLPSPRRDPVPLHRGDGARRSSSPGRTAGRRRAPSTPPTRPGPWAEPEKVAGSRREARRPRHVPVPERRGPARRPPAGLHRAPTSYARFHRMLGKNVLHCLGYDAFGLPAEQYAVQTGQHPRKTTEDNIVDHARQLRRLGLGFDDRRSYRDHRRGLLPLDAVDLPADLQLLVRRRTPCARTAGVGRGPADRRARRGVSRRARARCPPTTAAAGPT